MTKRWLFFVGGLLLLPAAVQAEPVRSLWNGTGTGGFHVPGAEIREGQGAANAFGAYTNQGSLLAPGDEVTRVRYGLGGQYAPLPYLELGLAAAGANVNVEPSGSELDSFGDFVLAAKGSYAVTNWFATGARAELRLYSGVGGANGNESGYGDTASYAGEWVSTARFGNFAVHGMLGYLYDRTVNFAETAPTAAERFAWGQTDFNQFLYGIALNYETGFADYIVELSGAQPLGSNSPALSESPVKVTPGLRLRPWGPAEIQLGVDFSPIDETGSGVPAQPNYELLAALRWHFGAEEDSETTTEPYQAEEAPAPQAEVAPEPEPEAAPALPPAAAEQAATGVISGKITHAATGEPVSGARVVLEGLALTATSNANGNFLFNAVPAGEVRVQIEAVGMQPYSAVATVNADSVTSLNVRLTPQSTLGTLVIRTLDQRGKPLTGVQIRINGVVKGTTGDSGELAIADLEAGMLEVELSKSGYKKPEAMFVELAAGDTTTETVTLQAEPRPGYVEVKAVDAERQPIAATLTVEGHPEMTRQLDPAAGSTATLKVAPGIYRFRVEAPGFLPEVQEVNVEEDDEEALRFKLSK